MSAACESVRSRLPRYASEDLPEDSRREVRRHLADCGACRAVAAAEDPSMMFSGLAAADVSAEQVAAVVASVRAGIAIRQSERRIAGAARRPGSAGVRWALRAAAVAAVAVMTLAVPPGLRDAAPKAAAPETAVLSAPGLSAAASEGAVENSTGATVYDWSPGAGEPRVVWIVDGSLDI